MSLDKDEPEWVIEHEKQEKKDAFVAKKRELEQRLAKVRAKELRQKQRYESGEAHHKRPVSFSILFLSSQS